MVQEVCFRPYRRASASRSMSRLSRDRRGPGCAWRAAARGVLRAICWRAPSRRRGVVVDLSGGKPPGNGCVARMDWPARMTCRAMLCPTRRGSRVQPPAAGISPSAVSGSSNRADGPTTRRSQASASSQPPATAAPGPRRWRRPDCRRFLQTRWLRRSRASSGTHHSSRDRLRRRMHGHRCMHHDNRDRLREGLKAGPKLEQVRPVVGMRARWTVECEHPYAVCDSGMDRHGVSPRAHESRFCRSLLGGSGARDRTAPVDGPQSGHNPGRPGAVAPRTMQLESSVHGSAGTNRS